jgi:hypothetical protein
VVRNRTLLVVVALASGVVSGCTTGEDPDAGPTGRVSLGSLDVDLTAAGCAESAGVLHAAALAHDDDHGTVIVEARLHPAVESARAPGGHFADDGEAGDGEENDGETGGGEADDGETRDDKAGMAEATVRSVVDGEVVERYVGDGLALTATAEGYSLDGAFTSFDGAAQAGDVPGSVVTTCPPSMDPGGGTMSVDGREVRFDLVACLRTSDSYEARARSSSDADQFLALRRNRTTAGWVDHLSATGELVANERHAIDDDASAPRSVESGLFTVQGARVVAEGELLGPDRHTAISLTCGIDLAVSG